MLSFLPKKIQFFYYAVAYYFPFYLFWLLTLLSALTGGKISYFFISGSLFVGVVAASFLLYCRFERWQYKWVVLFITWFLLTYYIAFLVAATASGGDIQYERCAVRAWELTLKAQLFTVPYTATLIFLEKKMDRFIYHMTKLTQHDV